MTKQDIPEPPERPPNKKAALAAVPDIWLAKWLARKDTLTGTEQKRLYGERARRRNARPPNEIGLLLGPEGVTPAQLRKLTETLEGLEPTAIHHPGVAGRVEQLCKRQGVPLVAHRSPDRTAALKEVIVAATGAAIALPRSPDPAGPVANAMRYARHRKVKLIVLLPNGAIT